MGAGLSLVLVCSVFQCMYVFDLVFWQPLGGGVCDQYPVIRIGDKHYMMSLRMMKAVW